MMGGPISRAARQKPDKAEGWRGMVATCMLGSHLRVAILWVRFLQALTGPSVTLCAHCPQTDNFRQR